MRLIVLTDIDDTLMRTQRKCAGGEDLVMGATRADGTPGSVTTGHQRRMLELLSASAGALVPVTARSKEGLLRVDLGTPFVDGAVVDFGAGVLNVDGSYDQKWTDKLRKCAEPLAVLETFESIKSIVQLHWPLASSRVQQCNEVPAYLLLRPVDDRGIEGLHGYLAELLECSNPGEFYFHVTDRDVCVLPAHINKGSACAYLLESRGWADDLVVGLGDSLSDQPFLQLAHFQVIPQRSRLSSALHAAALNRKEAP